MHAPKYPVPPYLVATTSQADYDAWLNNKSANLLRKDKRRNRPCGRNGLCDPYTGETMKYSLIGSWDSTKGKDWPDGLIRNYYLMPTVDHTDPCADTLELEICSWRTNECKSGLTPQEFIDVCGKVAEREQDARSGNTITDH